MLCDEVVLIEILHDSKRVEQLFFSLLRDMHCVKRFRKVQYETTLMDQKEENITSFEVKRDENVFFKVYQETR